MVKWLRSVHATQAESRRPLAGDDFIPHPMGSFTHAIAIRRPPSEVWPWLAQMGAGSRAGWYSYDGLDNGGRQSATRVIPELQSLKVGMVFPALPDRTDGFTLLAFDPERFLVLGWRAPDLTLLMTWAFVLEHRRDGGTRLLVRVRGAQEYRFYGAPRWATIPIVRVVHSIMERKQLLGVASRAEAWPHRTASVPASPAA